MLCPFTVPMLLAGPSKLLPNPTPLKSISITLTYTAKTDIWANGHMTD